MTPGAKQKQPRTSFLTGLAEWRFPLWVILGVLVVTSLPYLYGYLSAPPEKQFMGIMLDVPDHGQYFSWMRELTTANLAANKLTPEPNQPVFFNLLWWGLGRFSAALGLGYAATFQVLRWTATILFLLLVYRMCTWFFAEQRMRRAAFLVATLISGFGWVLIVLKYTLTGGELLMPLTVYIAESNTFLCILGYPHFVAAMLYVFVFDLVLRGEARGQLRYAVAAGLVALFLGWQHAYDLLIVYGVLAAYAFLRLLRDRRLPLYLVWGGLIIGLISWWPALYSVLLTSLDPLWGEVLAQFANAGVYTPNLLQLPILLGPAFLLAVFTVIKDHPFRMQGVSDNDLFLRGWFLVSFVLIYLPVDYQIHLLNGWQIPIAFLAVRGLFDYVLPWVENLAQRRHWRWSKATLQRGLVAALILAIIPTNVYLWAWRFFDLSRHDYPYYLYNDDLAALSWIEANADPQEVVLSSEVTGYYIPAITGTYAFLAHWAQTVDYYHKEQMVYEFFSPQTSDDRRIEILQRYGVDYVFYGAVERSMGEYPPAQASFLERVYTAGHVEIYRVVE